MTSNVDPSNIDINYPVAGQDNDSQGFRDNFANIKNSIQTAATEISEMHTKGIFSSAITGEDLDNDMHGSPIGNPTLSNPRYQTVSLVSVSGENEISFSNTVTKIELTVNADLTFIDVPPTGSCGIIYLLIESTGTRTLGISGVTNGSMIPEYDTASLTLVAGTYLYQLITFDNGTSFTMVDMMNVGLSDLRYVSNIDNDIPATSIGSTGDHAGMIAMDSDYAYFCIQDYDGVSDVWKRVALSADTW